MADIEDEADRAFRGYGVAIRREDDPPIPGEPFMSMADAKRITRELLAAQAAPELLSIAQQWAAIDGGAWHVERHARAKTELLQATRAAIAKAEGKPFPSLTGGGR